MVLPCPSRWTTAINHKDTGRPIATAAVSWQLEFREFPVVRALGTDPLAPDMRVREEGRIRMVAAACNHPNCLVLPFRLELIRLAA
jgi:hypothetical protein